MRLKTALLKILLASGAMVLAPALDNGLARTPPMGWYPWNAFGEKGQNEQVIREIADSILSSGMKDAGYTYVGPDEGACTYRDVKGDLQTNLARFPSGMKSLGDDLHKMGFKYALYSDAGPRTCTGDMPGLRGHEAADLLSFAAWGCDYLKVDWCNSEGLTSVSAYSNIRNALLSCGRPIVYSLCNWGQDSPWDWADTVGNLWRTTGDIYSTWSHVIDIAHVNSALFARAKPGAWNDPDMLETGTAGLNDVQGRAHFSLWCLMASPLIAGHDARAMTAQTRATYTNLEAIAVNQDPLGIQGHRIRSSGNLEFWGGKKLFDGGYAGLAFNNGGTLVNATLRWSDLGAPAGTPLYVRNVWTHTTTGPVKDSVTVSLATDEAALLRFSNTDSFPVPPVMVADKYLLQLTAQKAQPGQLSDSVALLNIGTDALPLWNIEENAPWLSIAVHKNGRTQHLVTSVSAAGLEAGHYRALVKARNTEPRTQLPLSTVTYDVEFRVTSPDTLPAPLWTRVDEANAQVSFSPGWSVSTSAPQEYNATYHINDQKDAYAQFTFQGTGVRVLGRMQFNAGLADFLLDGQAAATGISTFNCCYSASVVHQALLFEKTALTNGPHTLKVVVRGLPDTSLKVQYPSISGSAIILDAFEYTNNSSMRPETPATLPPAGDGLNAFPQPFNPSLNIQYRLARPGVIDLSIYALNGKKVAEIRNGWSPAGTHTVVWTGKDASGNTAASGVYCLSLNTPVFSLKKRVTLLK